MVEAPGRRILLIHDDAPTLALLQQALSQSQFQVNGAPSSPQAIRDLRQVRPDVVICRDRMPLLGGRHVIRAVAAVDPDIPVIVVSDDGDLGVVVDMMRSGALDCVLLPTQEVAALIAAAQRGVELVASRRRAKQTESELKDAQTRLARLLEQEAVIRERAFERVAEPLERASRNLVELQNLGLDDAALRKAREVLNDVYEVTDRLTAARTDATRTSTRSVALEDFHPLAIAEFVRDAVLRDAHKKGVEFAYFVPTEIPALRGDPGQLRSCLVELVQFLVNQAKGGIVSLELTVEARGPGPWLVRFDLSASDGTHDIGGPNVIDRYLPGEDVVSVREELIDLSMAARVVGLLGGELDMFEERGAGVRFSFELALLKSKRAAYDLPDEGLVEANVLLVDPLGPQRRGIANELRKLGMQASAAGTAEQGVLALRRASERGELPRVVFMSLSLPELAVMDDYLDRILGDARPERVYLARGGEYAPADRDALLLMRPPRRKVLVGVLKRYVGLKEDQ